jgi:hypothetical protein
MRIKATPGLTIFHEKLEKACEGLFCIAAKNNANPYFLGGAMLRI